MFCDTIRILYLSVVVLPYQVLNTPPRIACNHSQTSHVCSPTTKQHTHGSLLTIGQSDFPKYKVAPGLKDRPFGHKNVVSKDRQPSLTSSTLSEMYEFLLRTSGLSRQVVSHDNGISR